jgi:cobyrinic acid a,c-diamide synthase
MHHPTSDSLPTGFVLGGLHGSSGKTAITCLIAAGLESRGLSVQPFKAGPDFIDPAYHSRFCTKQSRNLDAWLMGKEDVVSLATKHTQTATGILEGVMGLFDGAFPTSEEGSTMELARWLGWPVVLCIPAAKAGRSIAATLRGFIQETAPSQIAGVILNGVSGDSHTAYLREAIAPLQISILGAVPHSEILEWSERYLGLQAAQEMRLPSPSELATLAAKTLDLDALASLARVHGMTPAQETSISQKTGVKRVAIARDEAFHFYYTANTEWLEHRGVELVPFSPIHSKDLPSDIDALILGGGFPEIYAESLAENHSFRNNLKTAISDGLPCYAECGGMMLLTEEVITLNNTRFPMSGVLPGSVSMTRSLQNFGYCLADNLYRGHEFHHSKWGLEESHANAWTVSRRRNSQQRREGYRTHSLHASYVHLYFPQSAPLLEAQLGLIP